MIVGDHRIDDRKITKVDVIDVLNHPEYDSQRYLNDYSILTLADQVNKEIIQYLILELQWRHLVLVGILAE